MPDDVPTISTSRLPSAEVARRTFATVRRGFDPHEVRSFLEHLSRELAAAERREQELQHALAEAEERSRHPVLDEAALTSALGQRSAAVLRAAHEEAARIVQRAEEQAATLLRDAQHQASEAEVRAESSSAERIAEAELAANALRQQARDEAAAVLDAASAEGEALVSRAREQGRTMLEQAQEARRKVLADMAQRRRAVADQIEQFRAARDEIAASVLGVRHSVDRIVEELRQADDAARHAAAAAHHEPLPVAEERLVAEAEEAAADVGVDTGVAMATEASEAAGSQRAPRTPSHVRFPDAVVAEPVAPAPAEEAAPEREGVDRLFSRLRAGLPEAGVPDAVAAPEAPAPRRSRGRGGDQPVADVPTPEAPAPDVGDAEISVDAGTATDADESPAQPGPDVVALEERAEALEPVVTALARRLKRALQDDQNRLLDRLRQGTGVWSDELLVDQADQIDLYRRASEEHLRDAVAAGIGFARSRAGASRGKAPAPDAATVDALSGDLAASVVSLLRRRLEGDEATDPAERVGGAYREWRGERIERLAEDGALEAFGAGVLVGASRGATLRWVTVDAGEGCADCEDNVLAGEIAAGEEFPTGHVHPPAHAGCRCLVVPTPR